MATTAHFSLRSFAAQSKLSGTISKSGRIEVQNMLPHQKHIDDVVNKLSFARLSVRGAGFCQHIYFRRQCFDIVSNELETSFRKKTLVPMWVLSWNITARFGNPTSNYN